MPLERNSRREIFLVTEEFCNLDHNNGHITLVIKCHGIRHIHCNLCISCTAVQTEADLSLSYTGQAYVSTWKKSRMDTQSSLFWGHNASTVARSTPAPQGGSAFPAKVSTLSSIFSLQGIKRKIQVGLPKPKTTLSAISSEKRSLSIFLRRRANVRFTSKEKCTQKSAFDMVKQAGQPASPFLPEFPKVLKLPSKLLLGSFAPLSTRTPTSPHHCAPPLTYHHDNLTSPSMFLQPSHQQPEKICLFVPVLSWTHF